jgi:hypothetical protein
MPTQKRRRFLIKQKQKRRQKISRMRQPYSKLMSKSSGVCRLLLSIFKRNTAPTPQELDSVRKMLAEIRIAETTFAIESLKAEKFLGKRCVEDLRHELKSKQQALECIADGILYKYGNREIFRLIFGREPKAPSKSLEVTNK